MKNPQNTHPDQPNYVKPIVISMTPELQARLNTFRWNMRRAEVLATNDDALVALNLDMADTHLVRAAMVAYLRENSDPQ